MEGQDGAPEETVEVYSFVICTLRPEVVEAIQSDEDVIRRALEVITGVTFNQDGSITGTWDQVSNTRQLLDDMLPMMTSAADDQQTLQIGRCLHDDCVSRSEALPFRRAVIQFIAKYLEEELVDVMSSHALFAGPNIDDKSVLVQCCGANDEDANKYLNRFKSYYEEIEEKLWVGEFPYCSMLRDARCCYFLGKKRYIVEDTGNNKTIVICEKQNKEEIISIMHKLCALKHEDHIVEDETFSRSILASNTDVWFTSVDITTLKAQAIACPNDEYLSCSSGLSKHIANLAGREYKKKCKRARREKEIRQFDVVLIQTHDYGIIFNVIIPRLRHPDRTELDEAIARTSLNRIFENVLDRANSHGITSLAMPPLGTDEKDIPNSWVAEAMIRAVKKSISSGTSLKQLYIVDEDVSLLRFLLQKMTTNEELVTGDDTLQVAEAKPTSSGLGKRKIGPTPVTTSDEELLFRSPEPVPDDDDGKKEAEDERPQNIPHLFRMSHGLLVHFHQSDITKLLVDAIVNVTNETLDFDAGIAKQITDAAGHRVRKDTEDRVKKYGPIPLTRTYITSSGLLPCKCIIHAIGKPDDAVPGEVESTDQLRLTIRAILNTAETCDIRTLAMTLDTAGMFGVPKSTGVTIMYEELSAATFRELNTVHIVDAGEMALSLAVDIFLQLEAESPGYRSLSERSDRVAVYVCSADITEVKAGAIVCSNDEKLSCLTAVAERVAQLAGDDYKTRCHDEVKGRILATATAVPVYSPTFRTVINVVIPRANKPLQEMETARQRTFMRMLEKGFQNAIDLAARLNISSLAISLLGADQITIPKLWIARTLATVILKNIDRTEEFEEFIIADTDSTIMALVVRALRKREIPYKFRSEEAETNEYSLVHRSDELDPTSSFDVPHGFITLHGIRILIHKFDLTRLAVDVVVYITTEPLDDIPETAHRQAKDKVKILGPLRVMSQAEGLLCKNVLLIVCPRGASVNNVDYRSYCMELLRETAEELLYTVDLYGFETFAMNCSTSGLIKVPISDVMNVLCRVIINLRTDHLKEMHFVGSSDKALSLLTNAFLRQNVSELSPDAISAILRSRIGGELQETLTIHGVRIYIYRANITKVDVDAVVCEVDNELSFLHGRTKNIYQAAGVGYQTRVKSVMSSRHFQPTDVYSVKTNSLGLVVTAFVPEYTALEEEPTEAKAKFKEILYQTYLNALNEGKIYHVPRIATHPLGIEKISSRDLVAEALCEALVDGLVPYEQLTEIHIVDTDDEFLSDLREMLRKRIITGILEHEFRPRPDWKPTRVIPTGYLTTNVISVFVHENDITKLTVDAVVCFTNEDLCSITGISSNIHFVAGPLVQKERKDLVLKWGPARLSDSVVTSAGRLACTKIVNAVVPVRGQENYTMTEEQCLQLIRTTLSNIMQKADICGLRSLAIPTAAIGSFGVSEGVTAKILCEVLTAARGLAVNEIHLVDSTGQSFPFIFEALTEINKEAREDGLLSLVELDQDTVAIAIEKRLMKIPEKMLSNWQPTKVIPSGFLTNEFSRIFVHENGFDRLQVDAAVCFANNNLNSVSKVTRDIYNLSGPQTYKERKKTVQKRGPIPECGTVVTSGGMLACGSIIHAVVPVWTVERYLAQENQCHELVRQTFSNIMQEADRNGFHSLAIPTAALGSFGIEKHVSARILCEVLSTTGGSTLTEIHLIDSTGQSFPLIFEALTEVNRELRDDGMLNLLELDHDTVVAAIDKRLLKLLLTSWRPKPTIPCGFMASETVLAFIHNTTITKLYVDVIVCSADEKVVLASSTTKPIYDIAGAELKTIKERTINRVRYIRDGSSIITSATNRLPPRKVIHVFLGGKMKSSYNEIFRTFSNIIRLADRHGCRSLAMPAASSAIFGELKPDFTRILCDVLMATRTKSLNEIHLVDVTDGSLLAVRKAFDQRVIKTRVGEKLKIVELDQNTVNSTIARRRKRGQNVYELSNGVKVVFHYGPPIDGNIKNFSFRINMFVPKLTTAFWAYERFNDYEESLLATCQNAIDKAKEYGLCIVTMHPIGPDQRFIPNTWLVDKMCDALVENISASDEEITEIHIFDENNGIVTFKWSGSNKILCRVRIDNSGKQQKSTEMRIINGISSFVDLSVGSELTAYDRVKILVYRSDITKMKADATVCSNDEFLSSSYGVAKKIADAAGERYRWKCKRMAETGPRKPADVVAIETDTFGIVINAVMPSVTSLFETNVAEADDDYIQLLYAAFKRAFEEAIKHGVRCLILSPLCSDDESVPKKWIVKTLAFALFNTLKEDNQLKEIHIVDQNLRLLRVLWNLLHIHK